MLSCQRVVCLFSLLFCSVFVSYGQETPAEWVERSNSVVYANPKKALEYANRAMILADSMGLKSEWYRGLKARGYAHGYAGDVDASMLDMQTGLLFYEEIGDSVHLAEALSDLGFLYEHKGNYDQAFHHYQASLNMRERIRDEKGMAYAYNNIGSLYFSLERYEEALIQFLLAYPVFERLRLDEELGIISGNLGKIYLQKKDYALSLKHFETAVRINRRLGHTLFEAQNLDYIGDLYASREAYGLALEYYSQAHARFVSVGQNREFALNLLHLGCTYHRMGKHTQAVYYARQSVDLARTLKHPSLQLKGQQALATMFYDMGRFKQAYEAKEKAVLLKDSLHSLQKEATIAELMQRFDSERTRLDNERLQEELSQQKWWFVLLGVLSVFMLLTVALWLQKKRSTERLNALDLEMKLMRTQLNPHFIHNSLTMMQSAIVQQKTEEAVNLIARFAQLMRLSLENTSNEFVLLEKELETTRLYVELQRQRFADRFELYLEIDERLRSCEVMVPPMMVQPFVENAIEHAFRGMTTKGSIHIRYHLFHEALLCEIEDNGIGIETEGKKEQARLHYGIQLTKRRIRLLKRRYRVKARLEILDKKNIQEQGTRIRLLLPIKPVF